LDERDAADRLAPIRDRWEQAMTPSRWKKDRVREGLANGESLTAAIESMQREYNRLSRQGEPFADW